MCFRGENTDKSNGWRTWEVWAGKKSIWILLLKHSHMNSVLVWLSWPSRINRRLWEGSYGWVRGIKTRCSHSNATTLFTQPFSVAVNSQSFSSSLAIGNHCC